MTSLQNLSDRSRRTLRAAAARRSRLAGGVEPLEPRIAPAAVTAQSTFTFEDADHDMVKLQFTGTANVDFKNALQEDVLVKGGDIESVTITGASRTFSITFTDVVAGDGGDGVKLGKLRGLNGARITPIAGIFTVQSSAAVKYDLTGYYGTQFAPGGGLEILGSLDGTVGGGGGVDLLALPAGTGIFLRDGIAATPVVPPALPTPSVNIAGIVGGSFVVHGQIAGGISLLGVAGTGDVQLGTLVDNLTVQKNFAGHLTIAGGTGRVEVNGSVLAPASIVSGGALTLHVVTDLTARILAPGDITLEVGRDLLSSTVAAGGNLTLEIGRSIFASNLFAQGVVSSTTGIGKHIGRSAITGGQGLLLNDVGGDVSSSQFSSGTDNLVLHVAGKLNVSRLSSGDRIDLEVGGNVIGGTLLADGPFLANIVGSLTSTHLGSKDSTVGLEVGGAMVGSQVRAGDDALIGIGKNFVGGQITGRTAVTLDVGGNIQGLTAVNGGPLIVTAVDLQGSSLLAGDSVKLTLSGALSKSRVETEDGDAEVTAAGAVSALRLDSAGAITIVGASFDGAVLLQAVRDVSVEATAGAKIPGTIGARIAGANVTVKGPAAFRGAIASEYDLTMSVGSIELLAPAVSTTPASASTTPVATTPAPTTPTTTTSAPAMAVPLPLLGSGIHLGGDLQVTVKGKVAGLVMEVGGDVLSFSVGGSFDGTLRVAGDFASGVSADTSTKIIGGTASKASLFAIGGDLGGLASSQKLGFGAFAGRIQVQGKLLTDLEFSGSVNRLAFASGIGPAALGDHVASISVTGSLGAFGAPTIFNRVDPKGGTFVDGANLTVGTITTTKGLTVVRSALF
jgi:hypothetical protein